MDAAEAHELRLTSIRRVGGKTALAHPDTYARAGSVLTFLGEDWPVPPLYPAGANRIVPHFSGAEVRLSVESDPSVEDAGLIEIANRIRETAPIDEGGVCPECHGPLNPKVSVDPVANATFIQDVFAYARRSLLKMYDLTDEQISDLLAFTGDHLPQWFAQVVSHVFCQSTIEV